MVVGQLVAIVPILLLPLTIPFGVLVGILIGLGRISSDGEITAMRAAGVPSRKVIAPVMTFALLMTMLAGAASVWWTPAAQLETYRMLNRIAAEQLRGIERRRIGHLRRRHLRPRGNQQQDPGALHYFLLVV